MNFVLRPVELLVPESVRQTPGVRQTPEVRQASNTKRMKTTMSDLMEKHHPPIIELVLTTCPVCFDFH